MVVVAAQNKGDIVPREAVGRIRDGKRNLIIPEVFRRLTVCDQLKLLTMSGGEVILVDILVTFAANQSSNIGSVTGWWCYLIAFFPATGEANQGRERKEQTGKNNGFFIFDKI